MEKTGELKTGVSPCRYCGVISTQLDKDGYPVCNRHASPSNKSPEREKRASYKLPLKSAIG